jgi:hypothetical protein
MPSHRLHRAVEKAILGESFSDIHRTLDLVGVVGMRGHRRWLHDPFSAFMVGYALHGQKGAMSGLLHITLDKVCNDRKARRLVEASFK